MNEEQLSKIIVGESEATRRLRADILRLAPSCARVLIQGPTGSGKELVARALHLASGLRGRLVAVNVCAIPESLFESTLFGHVRGAFTGALRDQAGHFAEADGGTLFLDEIGSLGALEQAKLLRALDGGEFRPVGASTDRRSRFRLISATNEDLDPLIQGSRFRSDLWYRLRAAHLQLAPLAERRDDILPLARHFVRRLGADLALDAGAAAVLVRNPWPGNVRELAHSIEAAAAICEHRLITAPDVRRALARPGTAARPSDPRDLRRSELVEVLARCSWDTARAASHLGVHRVTIYRWMDRHGIPRSRGMLRGGPRRPSALEAEA